MNTLFFEMAERMALVITIAYLLTRFKVFRRLLYQKPKFGDSIILTLIFAAIAIFGTYSAIEIQGALANSRVIGAVVAGLLGGPWMGAGAGLISGLHRWSLGGFTGFACAVSTFSEGLLAGLMRKKFPERKIGWEIGLFVGVIAESLQMLIILLLAKPFSAAWDLVKVIGLPMIIVNAIGIAIFMMIVRNAQGEEELIGATQAQKALTIANSTLKYLRHGLSPETAQAVCQVIKQHTKVAAVSITDTKVILAHVGEGSDHHLPNQPLMTEATRWVLTNGASMIAENKGEIACSYLDCPLHSAVIVPLLSREQVIGSLKLYQNKEKAISPLDLEFAKGLAHLFSTQLEIATLEKQSKLLKEAELEALQAQINPHFLFNALNTIISYSRSDPELSRNLLRQLGDFFRKSLLRGKKIITLAEELERIEAYLSIEQARFGNRLQVFRDIDPRVLSFPLPPFLLQPLVENCVKHGILPQTEGGAVYIKAGIKDNQLIISIEDNGVGMPVDSLAACLKNCQKKGSGIGLSNVDERLKAIYGPERGLQMKSAVGAGTVFTICLPLAKEGDELAS